MSNRNKRGRPKKESVMDALAVRLPHETILEIDLYVNQIKKQYPGMNVTRADAIRQLIHKSLEGNKLQEKQTPDFQTEKKRFWE
tara:strand:- start:241 stop:492 length:252 start_codon:yes stop_codon:yes gene_type:complete